MRPTKSSAQRSHNLPELRSPYITLWCVFGVPAALSYPSSARAAKSSRKKAGMSGTTRPRRGFPRERPACPPSRVALDGVLSPDWCGCWYGARGPREYAGGQHRRRVESMIAEASLTISGLQARAVNVELERPVQTSAGEITSAALVLIDLETREGTTGRAYIRSYTTIVLEPLRRLVENLGKTLEGDTLAPQEIERKLQVMFRLLGPQGLTGIAASGIDMAAW